MPSRTRFIPAGLLGKFECCAWPPPAASEAAAKPARAPVDMRSACGESWG